MRSRITRSGDVNGRLAKMKCQNSAAMPLIRLPSRFVSSLVTRNGERALRPRSEINSAIYRSGVKWNYTPLPRRRRESFAAGSLAVRVGPNLFGRRPETWQPVRMNSHLQQRLVDP